MCLEKGDEGCLMGVASNGLVLVALSNHDCRARCLLRFCCFFTWVLLVGEACVGSIK